MGARTGMKNQGRRNIPCVGRGIEKFPASGVDYGLVYSLWKTMWRDSSVRTGDSSRDIHNFPTHDPHNGAHNLSFLSSRR